jgi:hypothetical protein
MLLLRIVISFLFSFRMSIYSVMKKISKLDRIMFRTLVFFIPFSIQRFALYSYANDPCLFHRIDDSFISTDRFWWIVIAYMNTFFDMFVSGTMLLHSIDQVWYRYWVSHHKWLWINKIFSFYRSSHLLRYLIDERDCRRQSANKFRIFFIMLFCRY